jgi:formylmethanofuran dehydrogenase subunit E
MTFAEVVKFHGHACPGLAFGFRVSEMALIETCRSRDEELVAIVENNSCAVDAIQVMTGCTFGKGNLIFRDYGKQVYTFIRRDNEEAVRIAVIWPGLPEDENSGKLWEKFAQGDRSPEVMQTVKAGKAAKMKAILAADSSELFAVSHLQLTVPKPARIFSSLRCSVCNEKVMEPRAKIIADRVFCIPCSEKLQ